MESPKKEVCGDFSDRNGLPVILTDKIFSNMSAGYLDGAGDPFATDISPRDVLNLQYGPEGTGWNAFPTHDNPELFDVVVYAEGQEYYQTRT